MPLCAGFARATIGFQYGVADAVLHSTTRVNGAVMVFEKNHPFLRAALDRIEQEDEAFFERIRDCYLQRADQQPARFRVLDASLSLDQVRAQLEPVIEEMLSWP